jgi:hypothetical protein
MIFCHGCGKSIHDSAPNCPHCGCLQQNTVVQNAPKRNNGFFGLSIASLVLGIFCFLVAVDDSPWDEDTIIGFGLFSIVGLTFGLISIFNSERGRAMAIAGIVMTVIASACLIYDVLIAIG